MDVKEIISTVPKRKNTSQNAELTMQRCGEAWKGLKNIQKNEVFEISNVSAATIHKTYKEGYISPPVVLALSKVADVNPLYLCGVANRMGKFTDENVDKFLVKNGFKEGSKDDVPKDEDIADESVNTEAVNSTRNIEHAHNNSAHVKQHCTCGCEDVVLSEDEAQAIIKSLFIQAKYNKQTATKLAVIIRNLLS